MIPPKHPLRCVHAITWRVTDKMKVVVLCELRHKEVDDRVCEFCEEHESD